MESQGGGEVRKLHIVYFLSRKGRIEHPHLIRVHHLSRNGVHLKDVKRWLGELRGKDMPESFSWSYKRKYKNGYLWQDLLDDDLITPISDNEYVLKGSEISSINKEFSYERKSFSPMQKEKLQEGTKENKKEEIQSHSSETSVYVSTKSSSEIEEESQTFGSETSTLTDDSGKNEAEKNPSKKENSLSYFYSTLLNRKNKRRGQKGKTDEKVKTPAADDGSNNNAESTTHFSKSKRHNNKNANSILHNLMTCGAVDTNESAVVMINKQKNNNNNNNKAFMNICSSDPRNVFSAEICKRDNNNNRIIGGSQRILGTPCWTQKQSSAGRKSCDGLKEKSENRDQRVPTSTAYKPVNGPNCSQCGKPFKPEKLHAHMKSCKGMKALSKTTITSASSAAAVTPTVSANHFSGHLLTH